MDASLEEQLKQAEKSIAEAEKEHGPDHPEVAERLLKYAALLRETHKHALDAVNVEARAKAIRAKMFAAEATTQQTPITLAPTTGKVKTDSNPAIYLGLAGMMLAMGSLFLPSTYFIVIACISCALFLSDLVLSRGVWWRALLSILFLASSWYSIGSLPSIMLVDATPIERFNYASENPEIVASVRQLDKPTEALIYNLCLPQGFKGGEETRDDDVRTITWTGGAHSDNSAPTFYLMVFKPNDDVRKDFRTFPVTKAAKDIVMPALMTKLGIQQTGEDKARFEDINGFQFLRLGFNGKPADSEREIRGFAYVAKEQNRFLVLVGTDWVPYCSETLEPMEATVSTFDRQAHAGQLDL